jgi:hypothetical protein
VINTLNAKITIDAHKKISREFNILSAVVFPVSLLFHESLLTTALIMYKIADIVINKPEHTTKNTFGVNFIFLFDIFYPFISKISNKKTRL